MRSANRADSCSVSDWVDDFISMVAFRSLRRQAPVCIVLPGNTDLQLRRLSVLVVYW